MSWWQKHGAAGQWRLEKFFDVCLECQGGHVLAHRGRLADDSPVFDGMFSSGMKESVLDPEDDMVHVPCHHISKEDMTVVLKFMYGAGDMVTDEEHTAAVIKELVYRESDAIESFFVDDPNDKDLEMWARISHELPPTFDWSLITLGGRFEMVRNGIPYCPGAIKHHLETIPTLGFDDFINTLKWANKMGMRTRYKVFTPEFYTHVEWNVREFANGTRVNYHMRYDGFVGTVTGYSPSAMEYTIRDDVNDEEYNIHAHLVHAMEGEEVGSCTDAVRRVSGAAASASRTADDKVAKVDNGLSPGKFEGYGDNYVPDLDSREDDIDQFLNDAFAEKRISIRESFTNMIKRASADDIPHWFTFMILKDQLR